MTHILRAWTFWIHTPLRDECKEYLDTVKVPELRAAPGNLRAAALFRDLDDGTTEVVVLSLWDSMESIMAFTGEKHLEPSIDPADERKLFDREPFVRHYAMSGPDATALLPQPWQSTLQ